MTIGRDRDLDEDLALVERCRGAGPDSFGCVVDAYQHRVYGFLRRMVFDADEAADLAQEVFVRAFQSFGRFDGRSSLRTWLFRIAHNLCIDRARRLSRTPPDARLDSTVDDEAPWQLPDTRWNPESVALDAELIAVVEKGIAAMSEKLRLVLILHDQEDLSYEEIATLASIPIGTVKSRLFLARAGLHERIRAYLNQEAETHG